MKTSINGPRKLTPPIAAAALALAIALSTWLALRPLPATSAAPPTAIQAVTVQVILDYGVMPFEQIIDDSDTIFLGQVLAVSGTTSNQDGGTSWDSGLPVYTTEVQVLQPIVATLLLPQRVTLTSVGYSPLERGGVSSPRVGQRAVFFVIQTSIAWRDGSRRVLRTTNTDSDSIREIGDIHGAPQPGDEAARLNAIARAIADRRPILAQPGQATPTAPVR